MAWLDRQGLKVIVAPLDRQDCLELQDSLVVMDRKVYNRLKYQIGVLFLNILIFRFSNYCTKKLPDSF
jgi:hypothetical protein